jgi:hypothetical protein
MLQPSFYSFSAAIQAVGHLERETDASTAEPSTWKQEDKASVHARLHDKETSGKRE